MKVQIIADSIAPNGVRLTTMQLTYQRFFHSEFMTHRVFSRNASSSRAIPVRKVLSQVWNDPATPIHWGANQAGMQAKGQLKGVKLALAKGLWKWAGRAACVFAWGMMKVGLHKQVANRLLEPWQYIHVVVSSTDWDNFFELRDHPDAQPEIQALARDMKFALTASVPRRLALGQWHLPYVEQDLADNDTLLPMFKKISVARCARVSYALHDGSYPSTAKDVELHDRLVASRPRHSSPAEHQATPSLLSTDRSGNFRGWVQYRQMLESGE